MAGLEMAYRQVGLGWNNLALLALGQKVPGNEVLPWVPGLAYGRRWLYHDTQYSHLLDFDQAGYP